MFYHTERQILGNGSMLDVAQFCFAADDLCPWFEQCKVYLAGDVGENTYHLLHHHKLNKTLEVGAWPSWTDCRHRSLQSMSAHVTDVRRRLRSQIYETSDVCAQW